jgi:nucleotide-binding universal stress UspA family protein
MAEAEAFVARRILVGMDASAASLDALAAAASLAARLGSYLTGLFVEDEDLLRLAGLPFGAILRTAGAGHEPLDRPSAEAELRAVASHVREALERAAASQRVEFSFRVVRGRVVREVLAAAEGADLVVLGAAGHGRSGRGGVGETARAAVQRAQSPVLLLAHGSRLGGAVVAVDDGSPAGARAIAAARRLSPEGRPPGIVAWTGRGVASLVAAIGRLDPSLVVVPAGAAEAAGRAVETLLATGIAVLVVR